MIKSKEGTVKYKGSEVDIRTDLICLFRALGEEKIIDNEQDILELYRVAQMDEDEINEKIGEKLQEIIDLMEDIKK